MAVRGPKDAQYALPVRRGYGRGGGHQGMGRFYRSAVMTGGDGWRGVERCATLRKVGESWPSDSLGSISSRLTTRLRLGPIAQWLEQRTHNLADRVLDSLVLPCKRLYPKERVPLLSSPVQGLLSGYPLQYPLHSGVGFATSNLWRCAPRTSISQFPRPRRSAWRWLRHQQI